MAKAMALKYPVLRDSRDGPLKDNYVTMHDCMRQLHGRNTKDSCTPKTVAETPKRSRAEEVLMKKITSKTKDSNTNDVFQLLKLTMARRNADQEGLSVRLRFENQRENYKICKYLAVCMNMGDGCIFSSNFSYDFIQAPANFQTGIKFISFMKVKEL
ncbi:unnamed protein product [Mytilus coruscus]|uniref:Uncharacterized protein n=1 Tax=Mytilus coruscus TaxID=42192 RepID=A0A6J8DIT1_MYTCO|nr:unnamed protein product [Mytilus coruscus]